MEATVVTRSLMLLLLVFAMAATEIAAQAPSKTYVDHQNGFSVRYPADYKIVPLDPKDQAADAEPYLGISPGRQLVVMEPIKLAKKYNGSITVSISMSGDPNIKCGQPTTEEDVDPEGTVDRTRTAAGQTFYGYTSSNDGMGGSTRLNGYRGMINGKCWQFRMIYSQSKLTANGDDFTPTWFSNRILNQTLYALMASFKLSRN